MRAETRGDGFSVYAIAGSRVVLIALTCDPAKLQGLRGFAFKRATGTGAGSYLKGLKVFKSVVPNPDSKAEFSTFDHPIQSFLWSDYTARPNTAYSFVIEARYGKPGALETRATLSLSVRTEKEHDEGHGVWFNRGAIASQAFAETFSNKSLSEAEYDDIGNRETAWLSRGLLEACLEYIDKTAEGWGLRMCAYEFTYAPVLNALGAALKRGVDVQIIHGESDENEKAIATANLPKAKGGNPVLLPRTHAQIPHNKFMVRLKNGMPTEVWTGSVNFTPSGFLGQTNVGHVVSDPEIAATYDALWQELSSDPLLAEAKAAATGLSPDPANVIEKTPVTLVFSPRSSAAMLKWYAQRITDAAHSVMFTGAFGIDDTILAGLAQQGPAMRFIMLEKPPTEKVRKAITDNPGDILLSHGAVLGKRHGVGPDGKPMKKWVPIPNFKLEEWFLEEDLERKTGEGFVFFVHTKFLLVDPLSDDPLVCTGSANFSRASLTENDENMLLIRGNTRVADIYLTEFDRIFRHFYFRDVANTAGGDAEKGKFLDETDGWTIPYFKPGNVKSRRRELFFADRGQSWTAKATADPNPLGKQKPVARDRKNRNSNK